MSLQKTLNMGHILTTFPFSVGDRRSPSEDRQKEIIEFQSIPASGRSTTVGPFNNMDYPTRGQVLD